ncbi:ABC transporter permease [Comamonas composti]|uniref:ABC transporter permease n=1 Tax=Comamonas composti TaxID=408558 RepID=UPI0003F674A9|nr:ABC transporter permease [Comamonas composti]
MNSVTGLANATPARVSSPAAPPSALLGKCLAAWRQQLILLAAIAFLLLCVSMVNPGFTESRNLISLFSSNAYIAVAAIGMAVVIISGHIDVSVGALIGVLAMVSGYLAVNGFPAWLAWLAPVLLGALFNACVGALVAWGRIPSIVATLGVMSILKGGLIGLTSGVWLTNLPPAFLIAQHRLLGLPASIWLMLALSMLTAWWMHSSVLARRFYALGSNADAARITGIRTQPTVVLAFAIHGGFAGVAAVLYATQLQVIQSTVPANLELTIIAAAVVGGISILGGRGNVLGPMLAALLFAVITSALVFLNVSAYWLRAVQGLMILATVLADIYSRRRLA